MKYDKPLWQLRMDHLEMSAGLSRCKLMRESASERCTGSFNNAIYAKHAVGKWNAIVDTVAEA